jgi:hypothetical protein
MDREQKNKDPYHQARVFINFTVGDFERVKRFWNPR